MSENLDSQGNQLKYEGFPFIYNIDGYVQNELTNRSIARVRPITPFVKITPGFSMDGSETSKIILRGIESTANGGHVQNQFKDLYRPDAFFRPLAGVKSISVDYLNAFGSIKKVVISWVCHTLEDLERLSPYFLNPGQTVFVEWGWSNYAAQEVEDNPKINLAYYLNYVRQKRKDSNGNYDGMLGIILNYSFALNRDGGFECTTEVISSGYVMEGITIPNQHTQDASYNSDVKTLSTVEREQKEKDAEKEKEKKEKQELKVLETLQAFFEKNFYAQIKSHVDSKKFDDSTCDNNKHDYFILAEDGNNGLTQLVEGNTGRTVKYNKTDGNKSAVARDSDGNITGPVEMELPIRASVYATWGYIEDFVLNPHLAVGTSTDKVLFGFDSRGSKIACHKYLRTTDLGIFILPISNFPADSPGVPDTKAGETMENKYLDFCYVRRLLINVEFLREIFLSSTTINDAVLQLFSAINNVTINYWQFRLIPVEEKYDDTENQDTGGTMGARYEPSFTEILLGVTPKTTMVNSRKDAIITQKVADITYSNRLFEEWELNQNLYVMRTKSYSTTNAESGLTTDNVTSVVRNLTFQSKLSNAAALNVFYSSQNSDGRVMGSPSNNTFKSLYKFNISGKDYDSSKDTFAAGPYKILPAPEPTDDTFRPDPGTTTDDFLVAQKAYGQGLLRFLPWGSAIGNDSKGYWAQITNADGDKINLTGREGMKMAVLGSADGSIPPSVSDALVPLECEAELEGISGIRIGDIFTIDHIPEIYRKHGTFQVIGITDTVDKNSWVTKLKCQFRVFRNVEYAKVKNNSKTFSETKTITTAPKITYPDDPAPIINVSRVGASTYTSSPLAKKISADGGKNAFLNQNSRNFLVFMGERVGARSLYTNPKTGKPEYMLHPIAVNAWLRWKEEMDRSGIIYSVTSAYRSYAHQQSLGNSNAVATPGNSPHGFGGALDFGNLYSLAGGSGDHMKNLNARRTNYYKQIAETGVKYGWYNPWRLSDMAGSIDEAWHFEYWGPA